MKKTIEDHMGNTFPTIDAMCKRYDIPYNQYYNRKRMGWELKRILTTPVRPRSKPAKDHLGKQYASKEEMCQAWHIEYNVYIGRVNRGWTQEEALTIPNNQGYHGKAVPDHRGNVFRSITKLCEHYNISESSFRYFISNDLTTAEAITKCIAQRDNRTVKAPDHKGNVFVSKKERAAHYNLDRDTVRERLKDGWDLQTALETPKKEHPRHANIIVPRKDHKGNTFATSTDLAESYGLNRRTVYKRLQNGWTLQEALETPPHKRRGSNPENKKNKDDSDAISPNLTS
ncbi:MAG: hypothetical protein K6F27_09785 [Ruminococcus sp.]|nr:hypothetical protein [Ruminococcus sp.]